MFVVVTLFTSPVSNAHSHSGIACTGHFSSSRGTVSVCLFPCVCQNRSVSVRASVDCLPGGGGGLPCCCRVRRAVAVPASVESTPVAVTR